MSKREKYVKKYEDYSKKSLEREKIALGQTADACKKYIEQAHATFLGPLSALSTLKDCLLKIEVIEDFLFEQENTMPF